MKRDSKQSGLHLHEFPILYVGAEPKKSITSSPDANKTQELAPSPKAQSPKKSIDKSPQKPTKINGVVNETSQYEYYEGYEDDEPVPIAKEESFELSNQIKLEKLKPAYTIKEEVLNGDNPHHQQYNNQSNPFVVKQSKLQELSTSDDNKVYKLAKLEVEETRPFNIETLDSGVYEDEMARKAIKEAQQQVESQSALNTLNSPEYALTSQKAMSIPSTHSKDTPKEDLIASMPLEPKIIPRSPDHVTVKVSNEYQSPEALKVEDVDELPPVPAEKRPMKSATIVVFAPQNESDNGSEDSCEFIKVQPVVEVEKVSPTRVMKVQTPDIMFQEEVMLRFIEPVVAKNQKSIYDEDEKPKKKKKVKTVKTAPKRPKKRHEDDLDALASGLGFMGDKNLNGAK